MKEHDFGIEGQAFMEEFSQIINATDHTDRIYLKGTKDEKMAILLRVLGKVDLKEHK